MLKRLRKSSGRVTLVLIGLGALAGCQRDVESKRDVYASREDCLADWGNKPEDCTPATDSRHRSGGFFYGPMYSGLARPGLAWSGSGARPGSRAVDSVRSGSSSRSGSSGISRGGFGSSGRSSAS